MAIAGTFGVLKSLPADEALYILEAALAEPYAEIQEAAYALLADETGFNKPDLIVQHYTNLLPEVRARIAGQKWLFINIAKEQIRGGREKVRRAAYEMLSTFGELDVAPILALGVNDASTLIRDNVAGALEKLALRYHYHLLNWHARADLNSKRWIDENRNLMLQALETMLRTFPIHRKAIFLDIAIESCAEAYKLITDLILPRPEAPIYRAFLHAMQSAHSEASIELLFKLYFEREEHLRHASIEVMKRRKDPAFATAIGNYLAKLPPEKFLSLSTRIREVPWWDAVETSPDLEAVAAAKLIEFLSKSFLEPRTRDARIAFFLRSKFPDVRVRTLLTLQAHKSANLVDIARQRLTEDASNEVKITAAKILVDLNLPDKVRIFMPLTTSPSDELRRIATSQVARESFERYMRSFDKLDPKTRQLAAKALAKIDSSMVDRLSEEIGSLDTERRLKALQVIDFVDAEKDLRPVLVDLLQDPDTRVRATAIKIIELSGNIEGMKLLISCLSDPDRRVRANAVEAFEEVGDTRFATLLLPFVKDPDNRVRANAAKALWNLGRHEVKDYLEEMLGDPDELMRVSAVWAIGEIRFPGAAEMISAHLGAETSDKVRTKMVETLEKLSLPATGEEGVA